MHDFIPHLTDLIGSASSSPLPQRSKVKPAVCLFYYILVYFVVKLGLAIHWKTNICFTLGSAQVKTPEWWLKTRASHFLSISKQCTSDELWLTQQFSQQTTRLRHGGASNHAGITASDVIWFALKCSLQCVAPTASPNRQQVCVCVFVLDKLPVCKLWACSQASSWEVKQSVICSFLTVRMAQQVQLQEATPPTSKHNHVQYTSHRRR